MAHLLLFDSGIICPPLRQEPVIRLIDDFRYGFAMFLHAFFEPR